MKQGYELCPYCHEGWEGEGAMTAHQGVYELSPRSSSAPDLQWSPLLCSGGRIAVRSGDKLSNP